MKTILSLQIINILVLIIVTILDLRPVINVMLVVIALMSISQLTALNSEEVLKSKKFGFTGTSNFDYYLRYK